MFLDSVVLFNGMFPCLFVHIQVNSNVFVKRFSHNTLCQSSFKENHDVNVCNILTFLCLIAAFSTLELVDNIVYILH